MYENMPKILIVSHNALSDNQSNGKTITSFFYNYDRAKIAQLYLTTDVPDFTISESFFQLHDIDMLNRFFGKKIQGRCISRGRLSKIEEVKKSTKKNILLNIIRHNMFPFFMLARDILWIIAGFKTRELVTFIKNFNPDVVFFQSSNSIFSFKIVKWICLSNEIPLIMQITDDYIAKKNTIDIFFWIRHFWIIKYYRWAILYSRKVIAIGDKMASEYKLKFGGEYLVAMNSVTSFFSEQKKETDKLTLIYAGNLGLNRWKVLAIISECLEEIYEENAIRSELMIYSLINPNQNVLNTITNPPFSEFKGSIYGQELDEKRKQADLLIHVEAFDKKNKHITRLSISTKIPEYLASRRCIFAIGPENVASMQYLIDYDIAVTVTSFKKSKIKESLKTIMQNYKKRTIYSDKGVEIAKQRHDKEKTADEIRKIIYAAVLK